jgi:transposase-like protein
VEVDESYLSLTDRKRPISPIGRKSNTSKILVAIAVELIQPTGFGRIRIRRIEAGNDSHLTAFIKETVSRKSTIHTDGSAVYRNIRKLRYKHHPTVHLGSEIPPHESMPGVHRIAALLQRWLLGTHHGAVQTKQLDYYLDEFVFRFNRRTSKSRGLLFYRLLQQSVETSPVTYMDIIKDCEK